MAKTQKGNPMQDGPNSKQLIVEKIKQSANILVTVSANPSVDALTAALGLTLMLNKLDKHATAVFSGVVPPAINFLEPNKTFENNVDSLRDFIIALDKEKADRLRYKVENDVVRIFITPYRTRISQQDLQFSQGDFNVDLIVALGVEDQKDLDQAITAHGRILHDATVATINAGPQRSSLGSIDWQENNASSLSEMLAGMAETLKPGILDQQISTALLTGIVANTERFSNQLTTPRVMTISAQLMAAGANQQLIATKLQTIPAPVSPRRDKRNDKQQKNQPAPVDTSAADGEMNISHQEEQLVTTPLPPIPPAPKPKQKIEPVPEPEPEFAIAPPAAQAFNDLKEAIQHETVHGKSQRQIISEPPVPGNHNINAEEPEDPSMIPHDDGYVTSHPSWQGREIQPPIMGGTLNATAEQALEDKRRAEDEERNHKILTHGLASEDEPDVVPAPDPVQPEPQPQPEAPVEPAPEPIQEPEQPAPEAELEPQPVAEAPQPEQPLPAEPTPDVPMVPPPELVVSEPLLQPAPQQDIALAPELTPLAPIQPEPTLPPIPEAPQPEPASHEPTLEDLEREAASHAAQAVAPQSLTDLEAERQQALPVMPPAPRSDLSGQGSMPMGLPPLPPMPDFSTLPPMPSAPNTTMPGAMPSVPTPQLPPLPQQNEPATSFTPTPPTPAPEAPAVPPQPPVSNDPTQFRIPTQQ